MNVKLTHPAGGPWGWLAMGLGFSPSPPWASPHLLCLVFRAGFDLQCNAELRIPKGQGGKVAYFLSCALIGKHGQNLFSVWNTFMRVEKSSPTLTFHFASEELPLNVVRENSLLPGALAKLRNFMLLGWHFSFSESGLGLSYSGKCRMWTKGRGLASWAARLSCLLSLVLALTACLIFFLPLLPI